MASTADRYVDPVIEAYKKDVDVSLLDERLKRSPEQRLLDLMQMQQLAEGIARAGHAAQSAR